MFVWLFEIGLSVWGWFKDKTQRDLGKMEQQNADAKAAVKALDAELVAAVNRPTDKQLSDELLHGEF